MDDKDMYVNDGKVDLWLVLRLIIDGDANVNEKKCVCQYLFH